MSLFCGHKLIYKKRVHQDSVTHTMGDYMKMLNSMLRKNFFDETSEIRFSRRRHPGVIGIRQRRIVRRPTIQKHGTRKLDVIRNLRSSSAAVVKGDVETMNEQQG